MPRIKRIIEVLVFALVTTTLVANAMDITGTYQCKGNDPTVTPSAFSQKMIITKQGEGYTIIGTGSGNIIPYNEMGILSGDTLSMAYQSTSNANDWGVQVYKISHGGKKLSGPYIYWNNLSQMGSETCEKVSDNISLK